VGAEFIGRDEGRSTVTLVWVTADTPAKKELRQRFHLWVRDRGGNYWLLESLLNTVNELRRAVGLDGFDCDTLAEGRMRRLSNAIGELLDGSPIEAMVKVSYSPYLDGRVFRNCKLVRVLNGDAFNGKKAKEPNKATEKARPRRSRR